MKENYGIFEYIRDKSLATLVDELSLIRNIEYSGGSEEQLIQKAQKIDEEIKTIGDLNRYSDLLRKEIDRKEGFYLKGYELIEKLTERLPNILKELR